MSENKIFILGVGAQKAGTTWLHDYISKMKLTDMGFQKEYHTFDTTTLKDCEKIRKRIEKDAKQSEDSHLFKRQLEFMNDYQKYFDYFASLLANENCNLTGDITPSYSGLSIETLQMIKTNFENRDIEIRPIFLMRDPVLKLQSAVRMSFRKKEIKPTLEQELQTMRVKHRSSGEQLRSNYDKTITNLTTVFGDNVYYEFYECLFTEQAILRLCQFLNVDFLKPDFDIMLNVSKTENHLNPAHIKEFMPAYKHIYDFCAKKFGEEKVRTYWNYPE